MRGGGEKENGGERKTEREVEGERGKILIRCRAHRIPRLPDLPNCWHHHRSTPRMFMPLALSSCLPHFTVLLSQPRVDLCVCVCERACLCVCVCVCVCMLELQIKPKLSCFDCSLRVPAAQGPSAEERTHTHTHFLTSSTSSSLPFQSLCTPLSRAFFIKWCWQRQ